ncbi:hypothetical protein [Mycobacterium sp.]|uniref:hypothetical protein n=1 Tax=Mycobacterium sp. TaxID=1785 RepID=UPI0025ED1946|nr:hypothetical protein [Mycobacterium sp.]
MTGRNAGGGVTVAAASVAALAVVSAFGAGYAVGRPPAVPPASSAYAAGNPQELAPGVVDAPIFYDLAEAPCELAPQTPGDQGAPASPDDASGCITDRGQQFTLYLHGAWVVDAVAFRPDRVLGGRRVLRVHWTFGRAGMDLYQDVRAFDDPGAGISRLPLPPPGALASCVRGEVERLGEASPAPAFELIGHPVAGRHDRPLCDE